MTVSAPRHWRTPSPRESFRVVYPGFRSRIFSQPAPPCYSQPSLAELLWAARLGYD